MIFRSVEVEAGDGEELRLVATHVFSVPDAVGLLDATRRRLGFTYRHERAATLQADERAGLDLLLSGELSVDSLADIEEGEEFPHFSLRRSFKIAEEVVGSIWIHFLIELEGMLGLDEITQL